MIINGAELTGDQDVRAEVAVIGSGAAGAVMARELAEEGLDVVVLEEGRHVPHREYSRYRPTQVLRQMARSAGTTVALGIGKTPTVNIMAGSCVGGSSVFTGGVCFRVPPAVHAGWVADLGVADLSEQALAPAYERVEREIHVEEVPVSLRSRSTTLFDEVARKNGYGLQPVRRNTRGCCGCSRCNFGCPHGAKLSVDLTYLPRALELGARVLADHRVDRVTSEGGRVTGVVGRVLNGTGRSPRSRFRVRASTVVVAAGTLHTPLVLLRSRVGRQSRQVGRNLTLHPAFRLGALFDEPVRAWRGALQSAWSDHFEDRGLMLMSAFAPISVLSAGFPGIGPEYIERVGQAAQLATFGGMVHDDPSGRVRRGFGREPLITYKMTRPNLLALLEGIRIVGRTYLEAGARELALPVFGSGPIRTVEELEAAAGEHIDARRIECLSFHPLGSCRMGTDPRRSAISPAGRSHELDGLWVADGSVFPSSIGVNTQLPIMAMATRIAWEVVAARRSGRS